MSRTEILWLVDNGFTRVKCLRCGWSGMTESGECEQTYCKAAEAEDDDGEEPCEVNPET